ncbi:protein ripply3 [Bombina bombina]|uniref:protein ripply3 n=1 Tax=Bombina bombina TaxID=8345 RepID=UPI00235AB7CD|nr:protein ripply3 [Bombina bombina]
MDSAHYTLKATIAHLCPCSRDTNSNHSVYYNQPESNPTLWRPWVQGAGDTEMQRIPNLSKETDGERSQAGPKGAFGFQHPVRLYMPRSKTSEYLQHTGKKVLANFPVQATIHFYNDDSESEEEEEDYYETEHYNHYQNPVPNTGKEFGNTTDLEHEL